MINYKESEDIMKREVIWSGEYDSMGQKIPEIKFKYKVIRWQTDGTEEIWDASQKPTFPEMYKLINCTTIERQSGYDKDISNRTFDMWMDEESKRRIKSLSKQLDADEMCWVLMLLTLPRINDILNDILMNSDVGREFKEMKRAERTLH